MDHDHFLKTTPIHIINKWWAYYQILPFGMHREEYFNAKLCRTIQESAGKSFNEIPTIEDHMVFTTSLKDIASPGKRMANKVRSVLGRFRGK